MQKVLVIGAGTMGSGISMWFAQQNVQAYLYDLNAELLQRSVDRCIQTWDKLKEKGKFTVEEINNFKLNLFPVHQLDFIDKDFNIVIEAIIEKIEPKISVFNQLHELVDEKCIFATNTSGLSIEQIKSAIPKQRRPNFIGLHFFNPATIMKLVEIVATPEQETLTLKMKEFFESKGKVPVICQDRPGFICNRIARNFYGEAFRYCDRYSKEIFLSVDYIMREVGSFKMGPFELMDLIGIDINLSATINVWEGFNKDPRFAPHSVQKQMVQKGKFGLKSGEGFLNKEKLELPEVSDGGTYRTHIGHQINESIDDDIELYIDLSRSSLEEKVKLYKNLSSKKVKVLSDLSTYSKESFRQLFKLVDGSLAYKFKNNSKVEVLTHSNDQKLLNSIRQSLELYPVVHHHSSGHIFPRIISMIFNEAQLSIDENLASKLDIDNAMRFGLNYPIGPLKWIKQFKVEDIKKVLKNLPSYNKTDPASRYRRAEKFT